MPAKENHKHQCLVEPFSQANQQQDSKAFKAVYYILVFFASYTQSCTATVAGCTNKIFE